MLLHVLHADILNLAHWTHEFGMPCLAPESVNHSSLPPSLIGSRFGLPSHQKHFLNILGGTVELGHGSSGLCGSVHYWANIFLHPISRIFRDDSDVPS
jgi:hypothetical protein